MTVQRMSRQDDERLLEWLRLRDSGATTSDIGALYGKPSEHIRTATNRVYKAMQDGR